MSLDFVAVYTEDQLIAIERLAQTIWREHYIPIIGSAQVEYMLDKFQSVPAMKAQIRDGFDYYQVLVNRELIAYFSIQNKEGKLFLSKLYVDSKFRGKGYGVETLEYIKELAGKMQLKCIELTVNKHNTNSIAFYEKNGFIKKEAIVIDIGEGFVMDDYRLELRIENFHLH